MRGSALIVGLAAGLTWIVATTSVATAAPSPAKDWLCKVICAPPPVAQAAPKNKPQVVKRAVKPPVVSRPVTKPVRRAARPRHYAGRRDYYSYREVARDEEHGSWRQVPNDAMIPGPQPYGPPPSGYYAEGYAQDYQRSGPACDCAAGQAGLEIDRYGWRGGVGNTGGGEIFVDGYGMVHYGSSRFLNGPTYNSYGQSFPFNPSRARPFQPRVMGGYAAGPHIGGGFGRR